MSESSQKALKLNLSLDYRLVTIGLLAVIVVMLFVWKPWAAKATDRSVEVTGQATVSARPDEFVFYPAYEFTSADKDTALEQMMTKNDQVVLGLKNLGVADKDIKTNSDSWSYPMMKLDDGTASSTYTLRFTVTTRDDKLTQKVQDFLVSTTPTGSISPQATFSDKKRKELEDKARDEASKDARKKAEQSAENLGFKLAAVKAVNDGAGFGGFPYGLADKAMTMEARDSVGSSLTVQPGENDLTYTVTVIYYIK